MIGPREYLGTAGHFVGGDRCSYHLHTHTNGYCVSTVGEYRPWRRDAQDLRVAPTQIGHDRLYETMVFVLFPSGEHDGSSVFFLAANTRIEAHENHQVACDWAEAQPQGDTDIEVPPEDHGVW